MPLNARQRRFVKAYVARPDGTRAYKQAGYTTKYPGCCATRFIRNPEIRAAIEDGQRAVLGRAERDVERIVSAFARLAFANIDDVLRVSPDGEVTVDLTNGDVLAAVADVRIDDGGRRRRGWRRTRRIRVTLESKLRALDALARHLGLSGAKRKRKR